MFSKRKDIPYLILSQAKRLEGVESEEKRERERERERESCKKWGGGGEGVNDYY